MYTEEKIDCMGQLVIHIEYGYSIPDQYIKHLWFLSTDDWVSHLLIIPENIKGICETM